MLANKRTEIIGHLIAKLIFNFFYQGDPPSKLRSLVFSELKKFTRPENSFLSAQGNGGCVSPNDGP